jgi:type I site-specific restriction endonuclease
MNEADTCRMLVRPKLEAAGWDANKHFYSEQTPFTDGRIIVPGGKPRRLKKKYSDFLLRYTRDITLGVVEAKSDKRSAGDGLQQAKEYAEILGLKFAYATNGAGIIEYDFFTSLESDIDWFPAPDELWFRYQQGQGLTTTTANALLAPFFHQPGREPRYYQRIAIQRAVEGILGGKRRSLLTMATGTGKTVVAFQICWKLWSAAWNCNGDHRKPRILFLADRNVLVDDPKDRTFAPFGDARHKIEGGNAIKSREMYFATYQSIAQDERRPGLFKEYAPDFFDLIVVDECHRGSARDESNWRDILEYFEPAFQLGMTATPLREDSLVSEEEIDGTGKTVEMSELMVAEDEAPYEVGESKPEFDDEPHGPRKYYVKGGQVGIDTEVTLDLDADGGKLRTVQITQHAADTVRTLYTDPDDLRKKWSDFEQRSALIEMLEQKGIDFNELAATAGTPDADPFDLLCHLAYNAPLLTRKQRAEKLRKKKKDFFDQFGPEARSIINELLDKYAEHGTAQFTIPDVFEVPPISQHGNLKEIASKFGGAEKMIDIVRQLQALLYAA